MKKLFAIFLLLLSYSAYSQQFDFKAHFEGICGSGAMSGNYAYFNSGPNINILDISNPGEVVLINTFHTGYYYPESINYADGYLFISSGTEGFVIFDVSNPLQPRFVSNVLWPICDYAKETIINDSIIIIDEGDYESVSVFDISDPYNPVFQSRIDFPINQNDAYALYKNILYGFGVATSSNYLNYIYAFDVSKPSNPLLLNDLYLENQAYPDDMVVYNDKLLVATDTIVNFYDISSPDTTVFLSTFSVLYQINKLQLDGNNLFAYCEGYGILSIDISDIYNPQILGFYNETSDIWNFNVRDNVLLTTLGYGGFELSDISDLSNPSLFYDYTKTDAVSSIELNDNFAYMGMTEKGLQIIDITDPMNPIDMGNIDSLKSISEIVYYQDYLFCRSEQDYKTIKIIDVTDSLNPAMVNQIHMDLGLNDFKIYQGILFVTTGSEGLKLFDVTNPVVPVEIANFSEPGAKIAIDHSLIVMSYAYSGIPWISAIKTFKLNSDYNLIPCDEVILGEYLVYNPHLIEIKYPFIFLGTRSGAVVAQVDDSYHITVCDEMILTGCCTNSMASDDDYFYLGGHYGGHDKLLVVDYEDPFNLQIIKSIDLSCADLAVKQKMVFTAERRSGYSIYGDQMVNIPESKNDTDLGEMNIYPNPSSTTTTIGINLPSNLQATLAIYDLSGILIENADVTNKRFYEVCFEKYKNGIYICELSTIHYLIRKKMIKIN